MRSRRRNRNQKQQAKKEVLKPTYNRYEENPTRKMVSAYGGVGSIIETPKGAILIEPFSEWDFFKDEKLYKDPKRHIEDERFLRRLRQWFKQLNYLVKVPENEKNPFYPRITKATIAASYFPKWMFCQKCNRFDHLDNWLKHWKNIVKNENYHPPKCFYCYQKAVDDKKLKKNYELEQVRFILTSPNGNIADVPWDKWVFAQRKKVSQENLPEEEKKRITTIDCEKEIPNNVYYEYRTSDKFNNLTGISIIAKDIETGKTVKRGTLAGIFGLRVPESCVFGRGGNTMMKVVIRSSNSVYYPNILQSLQLPKNDIIANTENEYRLAEFQFITSKEYFESEDGHLIIERLENTVFRAKGIKNIYRLDCLKMTSVQVSYTRQDPIDKDYFLQDEFEQRNNQGQVIRKRYTSHFAKNTIFLPAIENLGEGIFFEFDEDKIDKWLKLYPTILEERANWIQSNYEATKLSPNENRNVTAKYLLIHTFSHLIIKELEFLSGYPATSLQERLFIGEEMQGVLIYTMAGAEGSYGGLVSLCDELESTSLSKIDAIIESALERALDCASDPICENTDHNGQGVGGTNLAACYSCALLPETSCEEFNRFLDRMVLVHNSYGFLV